MRGASRKVREYRAPISLLFAQARAKLPLVFILVIFNGIAISSSAQRAVDTTDSHVRKVAHATMSPSSPGDSSQGEYADLKLSNSVRQLAHWTGLPPKTMFHLCWDFNFFLMLALIFWKGGPLLAEALQARSRSIRRAIEDAQRLAEDAAKRLAQVEKRWAEIDSEIEAIRARAETEMNYEEQILNARASEDVRRIMEYSQSEIGRLAQRARSELKAFAGGLAVSLARKSIRIDERTDQDLVKGFIEGLQPSHEHTPTTAQPPMQSVRDPVATI
jgi:F0F1-type ATP synthase membrane subunit b/b'